MNLKASERVLRKKNMNPNDHVHYCVIGCHGKFIVALGLNKKVSCKGLLGGI